MCLVFFAPTHNILIEMDFNGKILQSIHDPNGLLDYCTHVRPTFHPSFYGMFRSRTPELIFTLGLM
jgi:hypothetical protein